MLHITPSGRRRRPAGHRAYDQLRPTHLPEKKRERLEQAIEAYLSQADSLIRLLDAFDKDPDLENDKSDYEYTNGGWFSQGHHTVKHYWMDDLEEDLSDGEASLGWPGGVDQVRALRNHHISNDVCGSDGEAEHDGREPSLGANEATNQEHWGNSGRDDREHDAGDECELEAEL